MKLQDLIIHIKKVLFNILIYIGINVAGGFCCRKFHHLSWVSMAWFRNAAAWGASFSQSQEEETRDKTPERTKKRTDTDHRTPNRDGGAEETGARHRGRHDESIGGNDSGFEDEGSDGSFGNNASDSNKEGESDNEDFDYSRRPLPEKEDDGDDSGDDATESAVEAPRLGAPRGERKWKPVQVATKDTKKQAIAEGKKRVGANTIRW